MNSTTGQTDFFGWPTLEMEPEKVVALTHSLIQAGVHYKFGAKVEPLALQAGSFPFVDCSGFVRWVVYHAAKQLAIPDGSANQHDWVRARGFKISNFESGLLGDGAIRIAFLSPEDGEGIGHVMLIINGLTAESHGGRGPDQREWGSCEFMKNCSIYVLTNPRVKANVDQ